MRAGLGAGTARITGMERPFEILEHPADVGFRARGGTLEELFVNAALAMMSLACDPEGLAEREARDVEVTATDRESLLFAWLAEILAVQDAEQMFFRRAEITGLRESAGKWRIRGRILGEKYDKTRHCAGTYIKAVTYHQLLVEQARDGWRAQVYLDV
jgi:SHS2 domain-containing protein